MPVRMHHLDAIPKVCLWSQNGASMDAPFRATRIAEHETRLTHPTKSALATPVEALLQALTIKAPTSTKNTRQGPITTDSSPSPRGLPQNILCPLIKALAR
jgi:hypothetical protein